MRLVASLCPGVLHIMMKMIIELTMSRLELVYFSTITQICQCTNCSCKFSLALSKHHQRNAGCISPWSASRPLFTIRIFPHQYIKLHMCVSVALSRRLSNVKVNHTGSCEEWYLISHALGRTALMMLPSSDALCEKSKRRRRVGREPILRRLGTVHGHWCCWIDVAPDVNMNGEGSGSNMSRYLCLTSEHFMPPSGF